MPITLGGGTIVAPSDEGVRFRSIIVYKLPSGGDFIDISSKVLSWVTISEMDRPITRAKIGVTPSFLTDDLDDTIVDGSEIKIYIGETKPEDLWFHGYRTSLEKNGVTATLIAESKGIEMERREVSQDYIQYASPVYSGRLVEIAKHIIDNNTTLDSQGILYSSTKTSAKIIADNTPVIELMNMINQTLNWRLWEHRGIVYMQPAGTLDNSVTLTIGGNVKQLGKWETDQSKLVNSLTVYSNPESHQTVETFTGDASALQEFTMTYPYFENVKVEYTIDAGTTWTERVGAIDGTVVSNDYTSHPEASVKKIKCTSNFTPAAVADNVRVTYSFPWQVPYTITDDGSIDTYGKYEGTLTRSDLKEQADVVEYATQYLEEYKTPFLTGKLVCRRYDLQVGEQVTVVDARNNISDTFTITHQELHYPSYKCVVEVGNQPATIGDWRKGMDERVRRLEERQRGYTAATRTALNYTVAQTITDKITQLVIKKRTRGTSFVFGITGANVIGGAGVGTYIGDRRGAETTEATINF